MRLRTVFSVLLAAFAGLGFIGSAGWAREPQPERTDWFFKHRYGVFVHYLDKVQNVPEALNSMGKQTSWDECVNEFNVELFADRMKETGAGYVVFTMMQQTPHLIAPNATFDRLTGSKPGEACSTRDLVEELYQALHKRNIDLMLYWTGDGPTHSDAKVREGMKVQLPVTPEYMKNWADVAREYGLRYGEKVKGYWVDGCYEWIDHNDTTLGILADGLRAGNPARILAFNTGVDPKVRSYSKHEDFTTGEQNTFTDIPYSRFIDGEQWHILSYLGSTWGAAGVVKQKQELAEYVEAVNARGGVVTIDMMLYRDGDVERSQLEVMKALRSRLAMLEEQKDLWKQGKAVPPKNIAWKKPSFLRSNDGYHELDPSVGTVHASYRGVDGDLATAAVGAHEWAWTYEVHLLEKQNVKRIVVHFGQGGKGYPTEFDILVWDPQKTDWRQVHPVFKNQTGESVNIHFDPISTDAVRIRSFKPDGPNQPGGQMAIAELEVYD